MTKQLNYDGYVLHSIVLPSPSEGTPKTTIAALLDPRMIPLLPPTPNAKPYPTDLYEIKQTAYKGAGMFARRDIALGELIVVEHPTIILPNKPLSPDSEGYDALGKLLPENQLRGLLDMSNCRPKEECPSPVEGVARTNALLLDLIFPDELKKAGKEATLYGGVFLTINRCNHSCGPNAAVKWSLEELTLSLYALRPIPAGEEIHKSYTDPSLSRAKRLAHLEGSFRFTCDCPWCTLPPESIPESDKARAELGAWFHRHPSFRKWSRDLCRTDDYVIISHLAALKLIEQEGLHGMQPLFLEELALCYASLANEERFQYWGKQAVDSCQVADPEVVSELAGWLEVGEEVRKRKWKKWGWRNRQRQQMQGKKRREESPESPVFISQIFGYSDNEDSD